MDQRVTSVPNYTCVAACLSPVLTALCFAFSYPLDTNMDCQSGGMMVALPSARACLALVICLQSIPIPVMPCPNSANTTCCACVSQPGCSWFSPPDSVGYCATSPYLLSGGAAGSLPAWAEGGSGVSPSQASEVLVTRNEAFHPGERRLLAPQEAVVKLAVGVRFQLWVRLSARSARTRLILRGPARATNGHVEFGLRPADGDSCSRGLLEFSTNRSRNRSGTNSGRRGNRARGRGSRRGVVYRTAAARQTRSTRASDGPRHSSSGYPRRRVYNCRGDGPGVVHNLSLELDVKHCLPGRFTLTLFARDSGTRSRPLRVKVRTLCQCPSCSSSSSQSGGDTPTSQAAPPCSDGDNNVVRCGAVQSQVLSPQATLCLRRGVNDVCVPAGNGSGLTHGAACSGRGLCVCGECACRARHELYPQQRFSGQYCQCDNYSCERSDTGMLCGGPQRGRCECGQCVCFPGWSGDACDMSSSMDTCVPSPHAVNSSVGSSGAGSVCSGRGMCVGGMCDCPWPYSGQFCECDNQACPRYQGELCGGPARGQCVCGSCVCNAGSSGTACQHGTGSTGTSSHGEPPASCLDPEVAEGEEVSWPLVCSGRGVCLEGECFCPAPFSGTLCQDCPSC